MKTQPIFVNHKSLQNYLEEKLLKYFITVPDSVYSSCWTAYVSCILNFLEFFIQKSIIKKEQFNLHLVGFKSCCN